MIGNWRDVTAEGIVNCKVLIALRSNGWQKSQECQYEIKIAEKRRAKWELEIIPVKFEDFDEGDDARRGHRYEEKWGDIQSVYKQADDDEVWMETLRGQLREKII